MVIYQPPTQKIEQVRKQEEQWSNQASSVYPFMKHWLELFVGMSRKLLSVAPHLPPELSSGNLQNVRQGNKGQMIAWLRRCSCAPWVSLGYHIQWKMSNKKSTSSRKTWGAISSRISIVLRAETRLQLTRIHKAMHVKPNVEMSSPPVLPFCLS